MSALTEGPALQATSLTVRFGGVVALQDVSIEIPANQITAVIGPNGAGKTTFFNAVCGFVRPQSGEITYRGRTLAGVNPHQLTGLGISRTLQGLGLWHGLTVAENVMAGARRQGRPGFALALLGLPRADHDEARVRDASGRGAEGAGHRALCRLLPGHASFRCPEVGGAGPGAGE